MGESSYTGDKEQMGVCRAIPFAGETHMYAGWKCPCDPWGGYVRLARNAGAAQGKQLPGMSPSSTVVGVIIVYVCARVGARV